MSTPAHDPFDPATAHVASMSLHAGNGTPAPGRRASDPGVRAERGRAADRTLALLLHAAERGMHVGVTVGTADGLLVTGTLVGTVDYCRALADQFASNEGGTVMDEAFAEAFRTLVDDAHAIAQGERRTVADPVAFDQALAFLHLVDARYVSGPAFLPPGRHGVLWRCRVADVTSWALGDLTRG